MTWIVGRSVPFGYSVAISDTCATLQDGKVIDCLQKIHPVGRFLALGFAGSVYIGFQQVSRLTELLQNEDPEQAWIPEAVAEWWPADATAVFKSAPADEQGRGCSLLLLSAHPTENAGAAPWARTFVHRFRAPEFTAEQSQNNEVVSIGSGDMVAPYLEVLKAEGDDFSRFQMEVGNPGGIASGLSLAVQFAVRDNPVKGISQRHFQVCIVRRGEITIRNSSWRRVGSPGGSEAMPFLARSHFELESFLDRIGSTAAGARC